MGVIEGRTWLELLPVVECWRLLETEDIGRVAVLADGVPEIYPVNHAVDDGTIVFRTDAGSKLRSLIRSSLVCFEVDSIDASTRCGWSVMIKGRAAELTTGTDVARAATLPLQHWAHGEKSHWVRIDPIEVSGRRIYRPAAGHDGSEGGLMANTAAVAHASTSRCVGTPTIDVSTTSATVRLRRTETS